MDTAFDAGLANGTFESGSVEPWTSYTTSGGSIGGAGFPSVVRKDTNGDGFVSRAAQFRVSNGGGGIRQNVHLTEPTTQVSVDVAVTARAADPDAGEVQLWIDDQMIAQHDFGGLAAGEFKRSTLSATVTNVTSGWHEVRLEITRASTTSSTGTAHHFVDNFQISGSTFGVLANDGLPVAGPDRALLIAAPQHGQIELRGDGAFRYEPDAGFVGEDAFSYVPVDDTSGLNFYSVDTSSDTLVTIDSTTGTVTTVGAIGHEMQDVDLVYDNGTLYAITSGTQTFELLTLDPATGAMLSVVPLRFNQTLKAVKGITAVDGQLYVIFAHAAGYCGNACGAAHVLGRLDPTNGQITELVNYRNLDGGFRHDFDALATDSQGRLLAHRFAEGVAIQTYVLGFDPPSLQHIGEAYPPGVSVNDAVFVGDQHYLLSPKAKGFYRYDPVQVGYATVAQVVTIGPEATVLSGMAFAADRQPGAEIATIYVMSATSPVVRDDVFQGVEDQSLTVDSTSGILINDDLLQTAPAELEITRGPFHGTVSVMPDGSFSYVPNSQFFGVDIFQYQRRSGNEVSNVATVSIQVDPVPDAPTAFNDVFEVLQDQTYVADSAQGVLSNDDDPDGDPLTTVLESGTTHGDLLLNADGSFQYDPMPGFVGTDQFTYHATDGMFQSSTATVLLSVIPPPPPVASADQYDVAEDEMLDVTADQGGVLANDLASTGGPLRTELIDNVSHGQIDLRPDGSFTYVPVADFAGSDRFTYRAREGNAVSNVVSVEIRVLPVDDPPRGVDDQFELPASGILVADATHGVLANDVDVDGDSLAAVLVSGPSSGSLDLRADGSFEYRADESFRLVDQFVYQVSAGPLSSELVTVVLQADAPRILVGEHHLRPNQPNQTIQIFVQGGQAVSGADLYAMIGDGGPELTQLGLPPGTDGPAITQVDLKTGSIFSSVPDEARDLGSIPQVANWTIAATGGGTVAAEGLLVTLTIDTTGFLEGTWSLTFGDILPEHSFGPFDSGFAGKLAHIENGSITIDAVEVVGRYLFYNHSAWDGNDASATSSDDLAIATDKLPLMTDETASFQNYSSYSRGLNGIMIDVANLPAPNAITVQDFTFRVGRSNDPSSWIGAPTPALSVRASAGVGGADRITLIWPDGAIQQQWLEVQLKPSALNLLPGTDRFYFGNAIGETGDSPANTLVNAIDVIAAHDNQRGPFNRTSLEDPYDFNRDRLVSAIDVILARDHQVGLLLALPLIHPTSVAPPAAAIAALFAGSRQDEDPVLEVPTQEPKPWAVDLAWQADERLLRQSDGLDHPLGDVNFDGRFDSSDLVAVFQRGKYKVSELTRDATWFDGDWDGDNDFDADDLIAAFQAADFGAKP